MYEMQALSAIILLCTVSYTHLEVFVDGYFQYSAVPAQNGQGELEVSDITASALSKGHHRVELIAYDRFLNRTSKTVDVNI